ncbi:peptidoglycan-binding protein [Streptomyces sp. N35]|uniref:peptidoglycan-binding protein n=1 Tax=Streptomyces sp. N35 TaxID=2795730 RepID=UPI0018F43DA0|nr:peptidoglycan-binding protein [Streptomyces sp. N35]
MSLPVFEEFTPARDCSCQGCVRRRRSVLRGLVGGESNPIAARCNTRAALILVTAVGAVLSGAGAGTATAAVEQNGHLAPSRTDAPSPTPQGAPGSLEGAAGRGRAGVKAVSRNEIIDRAKRWVTAGVPYSMSSYWSDGYRQDCSGFISMAWNLGSNQWTGSLSQYGTRISKSELQPGDMLLFHNPSNPSRGSHVTLFGGWANASKTQYIAYEQTRPKTIKRTTPYAYWSNSSRYVAYRANNLTSSGSNSPGDTPSHAAFPGAKSFGPGSENRYVTQLGQMLISRGAKNYYSVGPSSRWGDADRRATQAFQRAQGWTGRMADGIPGAATWDYLVNGKGRNIGAGTSGGGPHAVTFPGAATFRPGRSSAYVEQLGKQLVKRGFGKYYTQGPGPRWSESDRRNVEAFQRAQGWRGVDADGYPGPETWRRLFA